MRLRVALFVAVLLASALVLTSPTARAAPGEIQGDLPAAGGAAAVVWGGGDAEALRTAAAAQGCGLRSVWVFLGGAPVGLLVGAPSFVNASFMAVFPGGNMPAGTIAILRCDAITPSPVPTSTPPPSAAEWTPPATLQQPIIDDLNSTLPDYSRSEWQHWIDEDDDCQDTRQEVLIAESRIEVVFESPDQCRVASGEWLDPYTGAAVTDPGALDIDHLV